MSQDLLNISLEQMARTETSVSWILLLPPTLRIVEHVPSGCVFYPQVVPRATSII